MTTDLGPYRVERVEAPHGRGTRWQITNRLGRALVWTTDPAEAYHLLDLLNENTAAATGEQRRSGGAGAGVPG